MLLPQSNFSGRASPSCVPHHLFEATNRFRLTISHQRISQLQFALHATVSKPFHPASIFCPSITNASKPPGFADFTNFSTASFFRPLLRQADAPIANQLLSNSFASPSPSRCSQCPTFALKDLFSLRSCGASFAHNYSPFIRRFFIALNSLDLSRTIVASDSIDSSLSFVLLKQNLISLSSSSHPTSASSFATRS